MPSLVIHAGRALTPREEVRDARIVVEDGRITAVGPRSAVSAPANARVCDAPDAVAVPGFVDVHIHGAGGHDVMEGDAAGLHAIATTVARYGTTTLVATTVTASADATCRSLQAIAHHIRQQPAVPDAPAAHFSGIHFEGPFISHARRGVHPADWIAAPSLELFRRFLQAADGQGRILTLAPELARALEIVDAARQAGLVVGMGHTDATFAQAQAAMARGANHAVHVFNAMHPFSHRETGIIGAVLTSTHVTAELIADGVHVDAPAMQILLATKGTDGVVLVTDATAAAGMPDGTYQLGPLQVTVSGGVCRSAEGKLAGSTLTPDRALRNIVALGVPLREAVKMFTANPARLLGLEGKKGVLVPGADADIVLLTSDLRVKGVLTRGVGLA